MEAGKPIPPHIAPPDTPDGYGLWLEAFWELSTDRSVHEAGLGPIPSRSIREWTRGWNQEEAEYFRVFIRRLDKAFLSASNKRLAYLPPVEDEAEAGPRNPARDDFRQRFKR